MQIKNRVEITRSKYIDINKNYQLIAKGDDRYQVEKT